MSWSNKKKRGRPAKLSQLSITQPCDRVTQRRELYAFVRAAKGPDGRGGTIDQDVCDGIGQLHVLGLLDGHGIESQDLRDKGREWRDHYIGLPFHTGYKTGSYERTDRSKGFSAYTARDARFDTIDKKLRGFERSVLMSLLVDPVVGSYPGGKENAPWVESFICQGLIAMNKKPPRWMQPIKLPGQYERDQFAAALRGLFILVDGARPARWAA